MPKGSKNNDFSCVLLYFKDFGLSRKRFKNWSKIDPKIGWQSIQHLIFWDLGSDFWKFGRLFEASDFRWIFDRRKVGRKSRKWRAEAAKKSDARFFGEGSAASAGPVEPFGIWSLMLSEFGSTRPAPPQGGCGGYLKGYRLCRRPQLSWYYVGSNHFGIMCNVSIKG